MPWDLGVIDLFAVSGVDEITVDESDLGCSADKELFLDIFAGSDEDFTAHCRRRLDDFLWILDLSA